MELKALRRRYRYEGDDTTAVSTWLEARDLFARAVVALLALSRVLLGVPNPHLKGSLSNARLRVLGQNPFRACKSTPPIYPCLAASWTRQRILPFPPANVQDTSCLQPWPERARPNLNENWFWPVRLLDRASLPAARGPLFLDPCLASPIPRAFAGCVEVLSARVRRVNGVCITKAQAALVEAGARKSSSHDFVA